ncbi:MAG: nitroreductase family protein [Solobacterium sp.]|nr:nitroreductase family protein [Solobacterium sp.]
MEFDVLIKERYSVRKYADTPVEPEKLQAVLEAGMLAPTGVNAQPQRIYILSSEDAITKIRSLTKMAFNAPVVLMVTLCRDEQWVNPLEDGYAAGIQDVSIVATHMMLKAADIGLGTCWVNYFAPSKVKEAFSVPENEDVILLMPIGYPAADSRPSSKHFASKRLEDITTCL